jgi:hypothetical protein
MQEENTKYVFRLNSAKFGRFWQNLEQLDVYMVYECVDFSKIAAKLQILPIFSNFKNHFFSQQLKKTKNAEIFLIIDLSTH